MARHTRQPLSTERKHDAEVAIRNLELSVRFSVTDYTVEFLAAKIRSEEYYVPEYQREMIWDDDVQSRFIESVLIGLPIPVVFLWQDDDGRMEIVDGSQRMRTLRRFIDNVLILTKLELLPETNDFHYRDLSEARQRKFNARTMRAIVLENATTTATRTEMFARINTGGRSANDAEVRRGSLPGAFTDLVIACSRYVPFVELTPISQRLINAREREELVVRFFCFLEPTTQPTAISPSGGIGPESIYSNSWRPRIGPQATIRPPSRDWGRNSHAWWNSSVRHFHMVFGRPLAQGRSRALAMKRFPSVPASHSGSALTCLTRRFGPSTGQVTTVSSR